MTPLGDSALVVAFGDDIGEAAHRRVRGFSDYLENAPLDGMVEFVPAFATVTISYDVVVSTYDEFRGAVQQALRVAPTPSHDARGDLIEVPVCYGGEFGPDLDDVASHNRLHPDDVIEIHAEPEYLVYMIGFVPAFPYLGGMSERIATPRRPTPRASVTAGSVGIAGTQTGVYPLPTPGGWQIIGRTPTRLFRPESERPSLTAAGDRVRFRPIDHDEYERLRENQQP